MRRKPIVADFERLNIYGVTESACEELSLDYDLILELNDILSETRRNALRSETDKERRFYWVREEKLKRILACVIRDIAEA